MFQLSLKLLQDDAIRSSALFVTSKLSRRQLFASIGWELSARKATVASSCTSTTWRRCLSVTSTRDSTPATRKSALSYTSTPKARSKIVPGMTEASADTDLGADTGMLEECCARTTWLDSVLMERRANTCIHVSNFRQQQIWVKSCPNVLQCVIIVVSSAIKLRSARNSLQSNGKRNLRQTKSSTGKSLLWNNKILNTITISSKSFKVSSGSSKRTPAMTRIVKHHRTCSKSTQTNHHYRCLRLDSTHTGNSTATKITINPDLHFNLVSSKTSLASNAALKDITLIAAIVFSTTASWMAKQLSLSLTCWLKRPCAALRVAKCNWLIKKIIQIKIGKISLVDLIWLYIFVGSEASSDCLCRSGQEDFDEILLPEKVFCWRKFKSL